MHSPAAIEYYNCKLSRTTKPHTPTGCVKLTSSCEYAFRWIFRGSILLPKHAPDCAAHHTSDKLRSPIFKLCHLLGQPITIVATIQFMRQRRSPMLWRTYKWIALFL